VTKRRKRAVFAVFRRAAGLRPGFPLSSYLERRLKKNHARREESGITTSETEFLAHLVMPDGHTVADHAMPAVLQAMESGKVPRRPLLPEFTT
jgi:hypothetical protein